MSIIYNPQNLPVSVTLVKVAIFAAISPTGPIKVGVIKVIIFPLYIAPTILRILRVNLFKAIVWLVASIVEDHSLNEIAIVIPIFHP